MTWGSLIGHREVVNRFAKLVSNNKLASTYLFCGIEGIGKRRFAETLAETLLCRERNPGDFSPCGRCSSCLQLRAKSHPDLLIVEKIAGKNALLIEQFVGDREHRSQAGLCRDIRIKPNLGSRKIAIIDDADYLNAESGNALLKTLEEPPPFALLILIGTSPHRQLSTILSRSQIVRFMPLSSQEVAEVLREKLSTEEGTPPLDSLALAAQGSVKLGLQLAHSEIFEFRQDWLKQLGTLDPSQSDFAASIAKFSEKAGKESSEKKEQLYLVADLAINFYQILLDKLSGREVEGDPALVEAVDAATSIWTAPWSRIGESIERLCDFQSHIEMNANAANAIDPLLLDLGRLAQGKNRTCESGLLG